MRPENYSLLKNRLDFYLFSKNTEPQLVNLIENNINDCIHKNRDPYQYALADMNLCHKDMMLCLDSLVIQTDTVSNKDKVRLLLSRLLNHIRYEREQCKSSVVSRHYLDAGIYKAKADLMMALYHDIRYHFGIGRHMSAIIFDFKEKDIDPQKRICGGNHPFFTPIIFHRIIDRIQFWLTNRSLENERQGKYWKT